MREDGADPATPWRHLLHELSLVNFRGDSYLWLQIAEGGFDNFMMRMRTRT